MADAMILLVMVFLVAPWVDEALRACARGFSRFHFRSGQLPTVAPEPHFPKLPVSRDQLLELWTLDERVQQSRHAAANGAVNHVRTSGNLIWR